MNNNNDKQKYKESRKGKPLSMNESMLNKVMKDSLSLKQTNNKIKVNKNNFNRTIESSDKENGEMHLKIQKSKTKNDIPIPNKLLSKI